jgi:hypothetical protein
MGGEFIAAGKTLPAVIAAKGFLTRMHPSMAGEMAAAVKCLAALVATVPFLARVRAAGVE